MRSLASPLALLALGALLAGCEGDDLSVQPTPDAGPGRCSADDQCPDRFACNAAIGVCYALDECGPDTPCPEPNQVCREDDSGYRQCRFERCESDAACADLECPPDLIPRCVSGGCICGEPCNGGCPNTQGCCIPTNTCLDLPDECMGLTCPVGQFVSVTSPGA